MTDDLDMERCSYCGAAIPTDIVRCPKCGEYTDGAGPLARRQTWTLRRLAVLSVALVALGAFLVWSLGGC